MHREQRGGAKGNPAIMEQSPGQREEGTNHGSVKRDVEEVKIIGQRDEELIADQVAQRHHGPVIVRNTFTPDVGPDRARKDLPQVMKALNIGVIRYLRDIVVDE